MKNLLLFFVFLSFTACNVYTVKNDTGVTIKGGFKIIPTGQCSDFVDVLFLSDFPLNFTLEDGTAIPNIKKDANYSAGHYLLSAGKVEKKDSVEDLSCPIETFNQSQTFLLPMGGDSNTAGAGATAKATEGGTTAQTANPITITCNCYTNCIALPLIKLTTQPKVTGTGLSFDLAEKVAEETCRVAGGGCVGACVR